MNKLIVKYRYWFFGLTMVAALVCAALMTRVNVNTDMTKYLPDASAMRAGLEVMQREFGNAASMGGADIRLLGEDMSNAEEADLAQWLQGCEEVKKVKITHKDEYSLIELTMAGNADMKGLAAEARERYDHVVAAETVQDGNTAEAWYLILACVALMAILVAMCQSWVEPLLFMASTGVAVVVNMGSNALLPSVSATTNSIVAILQLVLSMDYSIILLNRYRQEKRAMDYSCADESDTKRLNAESMLGAVKHAGPSILSSGLTTVVGLLMLVFMKMKIGMDLGVVLSKGVMCSLLCNFTLLPCLILWFDRAIESTKKRTLPLPTDGLARFSWRYRIPLAVLFVLLFVGAYWLHYRTPISFSLDNSTQVSEVFPQKNAMVVLYDNRDQAEVIALADSIAEDPNVEMVLSYPSLLLREYTAPQMFVAIKGLSSMMDNAEPAEADGLQTMLTEEMLRLIFYAHHAGSAPLALRLGDVMDFVKQHAGDPSSLIGQQMDPAMLAQMGQIGLPALMEDTPMPVDVAPVDTATTEEFSMAEPVQAELQVHNPLVPNAPAHKEERMLAERSQMPYADTTMLNRKMTAAEMAAYLGMDKDQSQMVYRLAKKSKEGMTPRQFVHFLTDDILKRKMFANAISQQQRKQLYELKEVMDAAMVQQTVVVEAVEAATEAAEQTECELALAMQEAEAGELLADAMVADTAVEEALMDDEDDPLAMLEEMMTSGKRYTAAQMAHALAPLSDMVDPALVDLLYLYYGSWKRYDAAWTMSLEQVVNTVDELIFHDSRFDGLVDEGARNSFGQMKDVMQAGLGQLRGKDHSLLVAISNYPAESDQTHAFVERLHRLRGKMLQHESYALGESVMYNEMKQGFGEEMRLVTILTVVSIFLIVALAFRSLLIPLFLIVSVLSAVYINVTVSGMGGNSLMYMAFLIVQSVLIGATIDYGILFTNYYREWRATMEIGEALRHAYRGAIHTIMTSGLILILVPGMLSVAMPQPDVAAICLNISIGALAAVLIILLVLPGLLAAFDKKVIGRK